MSRNSSVCLIWIIFDTGHRHKFTVLAVCGDKVLKKVYKLVALKKALWAMWVCVDLVWKLKMFPNWLLWKTAQLHFYGYLAQIGGIGEKLCVFIWGDLVWKVNNGLRSFIKKSGQIGSFCASNIVSICLIFSFFREVGERRGEDLSPFFARTVKIENV